MSNREYDLLRYRGRTMTQTEQAQFENELSANAPLRLDADTDSLIDNIFLKDAASFDQDESIASIPGAPLLERFAAAATTSDRRGLFYIIGGIVLILVLLVFLLMRSNDDQPASGSPSPHSTPQSVPPVPQSEPSSAPPSVSGTTNQTNGQHIAQPKPTTSSATPEKPIDLDKGLEPPKIYTDPHGHMPIQKSK